MFIKSIVIKYAYVISYLKKQITSGLSPILSLACKSPKKCVLNTDKVSKVDEHLDRKLNVSYGTGTFISELICSASVYYACSNTLLYVMLSTDKRALEDNFGL